MITFNCEREIPETIDVEIILVNEDDVTIDLFEAGDSVLFKFYLLNHLGREVNYIRPSIGVLNFLKAHKRNNSGVYEYIGQPSIFAPPIFFTESIKNDEKKLIAIAPIDSHWPVMSQGEYYVGDTFKITIDDELHYFNSRIYFTIQ